MARFKLYIEYDGRRYSGWQMQKNSKTIQGTLMNSADKIFKGEKADIQGSGRTDSGVHAICQVAHLEVKTMLAPEIIRMKFNDLLPHDINILEVEKTYKDFHARHDAEKRSYIYQISRRRTAFGKPYVWWIKDKLDIIKMTDAANEFKGMHDFRSFTDDDEAQKSTKVFIDDVQLKEFGDLIVVRIVGSHFLWKMVRRVIGVLVEVGRGNFTRADVSKFLRHYSDIPARYTAPPSGLFLENVFYEKEKYFREISPVIFLHG